MKCRETGCGFDPRALRSDSDRDMYRWFAIFVLAFGGTACAKTHEQRCPFCEAVNLTFSEQIKINDLVVIATLTDAQEIPGDEEQPPKRQFEVRRIFKGENFIQPGTRFWANFKGDQPVGHSFLCWGIGPPLVNWAEPIASHPRIETYLEDIQRLPTNNAERLVFFQKYLQDDLDVLAADAYDEFAVATYEDLHAMKDQMDRERLLKFVQDPEVEERHRRLYFTMLGVCGTPDDVPLLEKLLTAKPAAEIAGLDSLVACYLCLKGGAGLDLIEKQFLQTEGVDFKQIHQVISALRFHGTEVEIVERDKLVSTVRKLLSNPRLADVIIPDLARWEDWTVVDQLVTMFKEADTNPTWIRVPVFQYLMVCPLPEAKQQLAALKLIDPDAYQRALFLSNMSDEPEEDELEDGGWDGEELDDDESGGN